MAKLTNGRVTMEVRDDKADHYALMTGYRVVRDEPQEVEAVEEAPRPKRGRPRKAS